MDVKLVRRKIQAASDGFTATDIDDLNKLQVLMELHKYNSGRLFRRSIKLEGYFTKMEEYLNNVANKPTSKEHKGFSSEGFKREFADDYERPTR